MALAGRQGRAGWLPLQVGRGSGRMRQVMRVVIVDRTVVALGARGVRDAWDAWDAVAVRAQSGCSFRLLVAVGVYV